MRRYFQIIGVIALFAAVAACDAGRHSAAGFRLPDTGDPARGKAAFMELGCANCHNVTGEDLPAAQRAVPVVLGGEKAFEMNDGYLVTSIINPSYKLASYPKEQITVGGVSAMPSHADQMTVQQLTDIVAFLHKHYAVRSLPPRYSSY